MRAGRAVSWLLLTAGLVGLGYAGLAGDLEVHLFLVIPVVTGTGPVAALSGLAAIAGLMGLFWTSLPTPTSWDPHTPEHPPEQDQGQPDGGRHSAQRSEEGSGSQTRGGGIILLGPIPIAWGSDRSTVGWLVAAGLALTLAAIALTLLWNP